MSPPPHREKDAKVEGRDPPETGPKEMMAPFTSLLGRLLKVNPDELKEQQRLYSKDRVDSGSTGNFGKMKDKRSSLASFIKKADASNDSIPDAKK